MSLLRRSLAAILLAAFALSALAAGPYPLFNVPQASGSTQSALLVNPPQYTDALVFSGAGSLTQAVPSDANGSLQFVVFSSTCNFYASVGASAAVPGATTTNGSASMLNPSAWYLLPTTTQITVAVGAACTVTMSFWH